MTQTISKHYSAAIFDFDETIVDLEAQHTAASVEFCRELGADYERMPESFRFGSGRRVIDDVLALRRFFGWTEPPELLFAIRHRHFLAACRSAAIESLPGAAEVVRELHRKGLRLAIASSSVGDAIDEILRRLQLREFFELILDGSQVERGKPDPEAYLVTAQRLDVEPAECIVFEDSEVGVLAAKAAGMSCFAIRNRRAKQWQDLSAADLVLDSFTQLDLSLLTKR